MTPLPTALPSETCNAWARSAQRCVAVAAVFCALIAAAMLTLWWQEKQDHPLATPRVSALKEALATQPANQSLKQRIRDEDAAVRRQFWQRRAALQQGAWFLAGAALVLVLSIKASRALRLPTPLLAPEPPPPPDAAARGAVAAVAASLALLMITSALWTLRHPSVWTRPPSDAGAAASSEDSSAPTTPFPSQDLLRANWPVFRGWGGGGRVSPGPWPTHWNGNTGESILWKTPIDLPGNSSPIIWQDKIFLTAATAQRRLLLCYAVSDGRLLWQAEVGRAGVAPVEVNEETGFAAPTPATDGARVYAIFPTGDLAAFTLNGKKLWEKNLGRPVSAYGYAASLTVFDNKLIVQWDTGDDAEKSRAALLAFDGNTGKTLWQTPRAVVNSWASPILCEVNDKPLLLAAGNPFLAGYEPATGKELWRARVLTGDVAPSPVCIRNVVYVAQEGAIMGAIRADQSGDVTTGGVVWQKDDIGRPDLVSPLSDGRLLWTALGNGTVQCVSAADGAPVWEHDFGNVFHASPLLVPVASPASPDTQTAPQQIGGEKEEGREELWLIETRGLLYRIGAGPAFVELGRCELGEGVNAGPAFLADGHRLFIRGKKHLFCIGTSR